MATTTTLPDGTALYSPTPVDGWGILKEGVGDQYVDAVEIAGNAAYAGGLFTHAVKDTQTADRANLMSVDLSTGNLRSFKADTNGSVNALASDGAALYLGGTFTTVNGVPRSRVAKVDLTTGAVDPTFVADVGALVDDMVVVGGTLYLGGEFNTVDGVTRHHVAAVSTTDGSLIAAFDPNTDGKVAALAASPDGSVLYLGGNFTTVGTTSRLYLAKVRRDHGRGGEPDVLARRRRDPRPVGLERRRVRLRGRRRWLQQRRRLERDHRPAALRGHGPTATRRPCSTATATCTWASTTASWATSACACWRWRRPTARSIRRSIRAPTATLACTAWTLTGAIWWLAGTSPTWAAWV